MGRDRAGTVAGAPLFEATSLAIAVAGRLLIRGAALCVNAGDCIGVSGPSGCGKSSLLRVLAGLDDPAEGVVTLEGRDPGSWGWPAYRRRVLLVSQAPALVDATVRDNLVRPFTYTGAGRDFPEADARSLLARLRLEEAVWDQAARTLSAGQQQRVCLVRAVLLRPSVFLLDEPTSALDPAAAEAVEDLVRDMLQDGAGVVLVSHDPAQQAAWTTGSLDLAGHVVGRATA